MSRADGVLRVVLAGRWFDMIESGEKLEEYRNGSEYWANRLLSDRDPDLLPTFRCGFSSLEEDFHEFHTLVASRGYTSRTLTRKIKRIRWGKPRPEWSGETVTGECFIIELEAL